MDCRTVHLITVFVQPDYVTFCKLKLNLGKVIVLLYVCQVCISSWYLFMSVKFGLVHGSDVVKDKIWRPRPRPGPSRAIMGRLKNEEWRELELSTRLSGSQSGTDWLTLDCIHLYNTHTHTHTPTHTHTHTVTIPLPRYAYCERKNCCGLYLRNDAW